MLYIWVSHRGDMCCVQVSELRAGELQSLDMFTLRQAGSCVCDEFAFDLVLLEAGQHMFGYMLPDSGANECDA